jgi:Cu2+-exporting ATPase
VRHLVLDKTGTLTLEYPSLSNPEALEELSQQEQSVLLHLTTSSLHPLSRTLHQHLATRLPAKFELPQGVVKATPGFGLALHHQGHNYQLGKPPHGLSNSEGGPMTTFSRDGKILATFTFRESARPDAAQALGDLQLPVHILSGDSGPRVKALARSLWLDPNSAHGDLSPMDKAQQIEALNPALFLGDGANDSLAFDRALATGSPVADRSLLDTKADFLFTQSSLGFLPRLFATARWRYHLVRRVIAFTICYNIIAIGLCLMGLMNPLLAAILMPLSSLASLIISSAPRIHGAEKSIPHPQDEPQTLVPVVETA